MHEWRITLTDEYGTWRITRSDNPGHPLVSVPSDYDMPEVLTIAERHAGTRLWWQMKDQETWIGRVWPQTHAHAQGHEPPSDHISQADTDALQAMSPGTVQAVVTATALAAWSPLWPDLSDDVQSRIIAIHDATCDATPEGH